MDTCRPDRDLAAIGLLQDPVRRALYGHVAAAGGEVSRNQAAEAVGVQRGLAAFHLDKLVEAGPAGGELPAARGRGAGRARAGPAKLYRRAAPRSRPASRPDLRDRPPTCWPRRSTRPEPTWSSGGGQAGRGRRPAGPRRRRPGPARRSSRCSRPGVRAVPRRAGLRPAQLPLRPPGPGVPGAGLLHEPGLGQGCWRAPGSRPAGRHGPGPGSLLRGPSLLKTIRIDIEFRAMVS
jgi:hypothetical protein